MVNEKLGEDHSAKMVISSINFNEIRLLSEKEDWVKVSLIITDAARKLEAGGADFILLGANTMHIVATEVEKAIGIPLLHITDVVAEKIKEANLDTVSLLGTRYTMNNSFFRDRLREHGIRAIVPDFHAGELVNRAIYDELAKGQINEESRQALIAIVDSLAGQGADGVILGCTELPMLLQADHCPYPLFDTTHIHAKAAVEMALK